MGAQPAKFLLKKGTVLNGKWEVLDPIAKGCPTPSDFEAWMAA